MSAEVVEVLAHGTDPDTGVPVRRVRLADGSLATQYGETTVTRELVCAERPLEPEALLTRARTPDAA
jgi:hypothetical protein